MNNLTHESIAPYVEQGLINAKTYKDFTIYCYSKDTFFGKEWDDVTKACRGLVFYKDKPINHPFPKIFNLNETPETTSEKVFGLINSGQHYELYHKVNGHLTIVDYIPELDEFLVHTKGALRPDFEMITKDKELFFSRCTNLISFIRKEKCPYTLMFESVNPEDKHTLYEQDSQKYGGDTLVLLGGYFQLSNGQWKSFKPYSIESYAKMDDIPHAIHYEGKDLSESNIKSMFEEKETEGYVIWFPSIDFRVKIKTTDYWKMRFAKDLTPQSVVDKFQAAGQTRLWNRYPEEVADVAVEQVEKAFSNYVELLLDEIPEKFFLLDRKSIAHETEITNQQKTLLFHAASDNMGLEKMVEKFSTSRSFRKQFCEWARNDQTTLDEIYTNLMKTVEV